MKASMRTRLFSGLVVAAVALASCGLGGGGTAKKATVTSAPSTNFPTIPISATVATTATTAGAGGPAGSNTQATTDAPGTYTIKANDTWYGLAKKFGVDVQSLLDAQDPPATLKTNLYPGNKISLPDASATPPSSDATGGSTDTSGGSASSASPTTTSNIKVVGSYTVKAGDYWIGVAKALGVQLSDLLAVNNATANTALYPGKTIKIPAKRNA
jgi:D-gamma-glutamyl-meso-diaminopimelic acid endopeptidase CwlS